MTRETQIGLVISIKYIVTYNTKIKWELGEKESNYVIAIWSRYTKNHFLKMGRRVRIACIILVLFTVIKIDTVRITIIPDNGILRTDLIKD